MPEIPVKHIVKGNFTYFFTSTLLEVYCTKLFWHNKHHHLQTKVSIALFLISIIA